MMDKPKRKRSEKVATSDKRRLRWLTVIYFLFLAPYLFNFRFFLSVLIALAIILSVLLMGGYIMKLLRRLKENFLTTLAIALIGGASTTVVALAFTAVAWGGLLLWAIGLSDYISFAPINIWGAIIAMVVSSVICLAFTLELHMQITEFMDPVPHDTLETEKQKNIFAESSEYEAEANIPLELLAESESAKQKMK